jgi:hypothetical protein
MKAEFSFLNSRLSGLESSTKVRVDPVPPSPESQEDEVDREDDEIYAQEASKLEESLLGLGGEAKGTFATSLMRV